MQTAVRALNTKRSRRGQQASSNADATDTETLSGSDNGVYLSKPQDVCTPCCRSYTASATAKGSVY